MSQAAQHGGQALKTLPFRKAAVVLTVCVYILLGVIALGSLFWTPVPGTPHAPAHLFSEWRALEHVRELTDLPERQVGSEGIKDAAQYLRTEAQKLAGLQPSDGRLKVKVDTEKYSGSFYQYFMNTRMTNAYRSIDAVLLSLTPEGLENVPSVLIGAHYDSSLGTPGASDCASCVGVALETARVLLSDPSIQLAAPLIFVLNGGEETFSQGAAGFMNSSKMVTNIGVFINLESTGSGGPAVVFQATGAWTVDAYSRAAPYPRGTVVAQDCFELELIPADSDYSLFSGQKHGHLPGLDVAFLLDAAAYHTHCDTLERIRPGTVQALGENTVQAVQEFAKELAKQHSGSSTNSSLATPVYFDILGWFMVRYSAETARWLHTVPLAVALVLVTLQSRGNLGNNAGLSYRQLAAYTAFAFLPAIGTVAVSGLVGIARVALLGNPMVWFAHDVWAFLIHVPAATAGMLLPHAWWQWGHETGHVQGSCLGASLAAAVLAGLGIGTAFVPAVWALLTMPTAFFLLKAGRLTRHAVAVACSAPLVLACLPNGIALALVMVQRASMMGLLPPPFSSTGGDGLVGAVVGATVMATAGLQAPWLAVACGRRLKAAVVALLLLSAAFAGYASLAMRPYTADSPKHLFLLHFVRHTAEGQETGSTYELAGMDAVPAEKVLAGLPGVEYTRGNLSTWQVLHPAGDLLQPVSLLAPHPGPRPHARLPSIVTVSDEAIRGGTARRLQLDLHLPAAGAFGAMNVSGPLLDWCFARGALEGQGASKPWHIVRFAGNEGSEVWPLWFEVKSSHQLHLQLWAGYHHSAHLWSGAWDLAKQFPDWTATAVILVYQSQWTWQ